MLGTAAYVAPEVLDTTAEVTIKADIYGAGAMAYELFVGKTPLVTGHRAIRELCPGLPAAVADVVMNAISIDQTRRPTAEEALGRLRAGVSGAGERHDPQRGDDHSPKSPTTHGPSKTPTRPTREASDSAPPSTSRRNMYLGLFVAILVLAGAGFFGYRALVSPDESVTAILPTPVPTEKTPSEIPAIRHTPTSEVKPKPEPSVVPSPTVVREQPTKPAPTPTRAPPTSTPRPQPTAVPGHTDNHRPSTGGSPEAIRDFVGAAFAREPTRSLFAPIPCTS